MNILDSLETTQTSICCGSMRPTIRTGDKVQSIPVLNSTPLRVGDIVIYKKPQNTSERVRHRIIANITEGYILKGDNNVRADNFNGTYVLERKYITDKIIGIRFK